MTKDDAITILAETGIDPRQCTRWAKKISEYAGREDFGFLIMALRDLQTVDNIPNAPFQEEEEE